MKANLRNNRNPNQVAWSWMVSKLTILQVLYKTKIEENKSRGYLGKKKTVRIEKQTNKQKKNSNISIFNRGIWSG